MISLEGTIINRKMLIASGMNAEPFHKFLLRQINLPPFALVRPFNWQKLFVTISFAIGIGSITKVAWPKIQRVVTNKKSWAAASLVLSHF